MGEVGIAGKLPGGKLSMIEARAASNICWWAISRVIKNVSVSLRPGSSHCLISRS